MGLIFMNITPMNAATKSRQLTMNCHQSVVGVEKLSAVHNNKVAAANSPTTAGRRPWKTLSTLRKREAYEKPSVKRKKKSEAARKRKYK